MSQLGLFDPAQELRDRCQGLLVGLHIPESPDCIQIQTVAQLEYVVGMIEAAGASLWDIETDGWTPWTQSNGADTACAIIGHALRPWGHSHSYYMPVRHRTGEPQMNPEDPAVRALLQRVFEHPVIGHNIKFDLHFAHAEGYQVQTAIDTMTMAVLMDENAPAGLDFVAERCGFKRCVEWKAAAGELRARIHKIFKLKASTMPGYALFPIRFMVGYAGTDVTATAAVAERLYEPVRKTFPAVWETESRLLRLLERIERRGISLDRPYAEDKLAQAQADMIRLSGIVDELAGRRIELSKDDQLRKLLFVDLELPTPYLTKRGTELERDVKFSARRGGREHHAACVAFSEAQETMSIYSVGADTLRVHVKSGSKIALPILIWKRRASAAQKLTNFLAKSAWTGRLHGQFNQIERPNKRAKIGDKPPVSGRLSCKDPNLQNLRSERPCEACGGSGCMGADSPWLAKSLPYIVGSNTSKAAAKSLEGMLSGLQQEVYRWFDSVNGGTCDELEIATGIIHQTASARVRELVKAGLIADSGRTRKTRSGRRARVLEISTVEGVCEWCRGTGKLISLKQACNVPDRVFKLEGIDLGFLAWLDQWGAYRDGNLVILPITRVYIDYSQVELRVSGFYSREPSYLNAYRDGVDVHTQTAADIFGVEKPTKLQRQTGKIFNFGTGYGMTDAGIFANAQKSGIAMTRKQARDYYDAFWKAKSTMKRWRDQSLAAWTKAGGFVNLYGRARRLPGLQSQDRSVRASEERTAIASYVSGTAADLMKIKMLGVEEDLRIHYGIGYHADIAAQQIPVHDETQIVVPTHGRDAFIRRAAATMTDVPEMDVPIEVGVEITTTHWAEKVDYDDWRES